MAGTTHPRPHTKLHRRLWRWRRNPLKRRSDRVEAWIVAATAVTLTLGAPTAGAAAATATIASAPQPPPGWHRTTAVLVEQAPSTAFSGGYRIASQDVRTTVRWTAGGAQHTGQALVRPDTPAGSRTTVWLDAKGALRDNPTNPSVVRARAIAYGTVAFSGTCLLAFGGRAGAMALLNRRRADELDHEWARVGPEWGTTARG